MDEYTCFGCGEKKKGHSSVGMNMPGVTPGPIYFCYECEPVKSPEEIMDSMDSFIMAPQEPESVGKRN